MVADTQGKPVPKAEVVVGKSGRGEFRETTTLEDGSFVAKCCRTGETCLAVSAKGFATKVLNLNLEADSTPQNIILEPGRAVRLKVVDQDGRPVAKASISARLPGYILPPLGTTDTNGIANVQEAPAGAMTVQVRASGYAPMEAEVTADEQEHLVELRKETILFGAITDATTGRPIPQFRVICGSPHFRITLAATNVAFSPSPMSVDWYRFINGKFRLPMKNFFGHTMATESGFMVKF